MNDIDPKPVVIYALLDRATETCYVGQAEDLLKRVAFHFWEAGRDGVRDSHKRRWLRQMAARGVLPQVRVLCTCRDREEAEQRELECMERAVRKGWTLTNKTKQTRHRNKTKRPNDPKLSDDGVRGR